MAGKILIVEDEKDLLVLLEARLKSKGYEVIEAIDGKEGFAKALNEKPDLIILDLMLPKVDGLWVCNILKHDKKMLSIPIIVVSARSSREDLATAKECGADEYFVKPIDIPKLLDKIDGFLRRSSARRTGQE